MCYCIHDKILLPLCVHVDCLRESLSLASLWILGKPIPFPTLICDCDHDTAHADDFWPYFEMIVCRQNLAMHRPALDAPEAGPLRISHSQARHRGVPSHSGAKLVLLTNRPELWVEYYGSRSTLTSGGENTNLWGHVPCDSLFRIQTPQVPCILIEYGNKSLCTVMLLLSRLVLVSVCRVPKLLLTLHVRHPVPVDVFSPWWWFSMSTMSGSPLGRVSGWFVGVLITWVGLPRPLINQQPCWLWVVFN